jgi:hypothetical protein
MAVTIQNNNKHERIRLYFLLLFLPFALLQSENSLAQKDSIPARSYYFYHSYKYGSQGVYNPLTFLLNGGYDIYQLNGSDRRIFKFPFGRSADNVFWNLGHPGKVIGEVGWWKFTRTELLPLTFNGEDARWVPNYLLHLIGGGMSYTAMSEWYRFHHVKHPKILSFVTIMTAQLINEVIENNGYKGSNSDPIPDIYIFNFASVALFSSEKINSFFSRKLHMADWSLQPSLTFTNFELHNSGQYFSFKWEIPFERRLSLFVRLGMGSLIGPSWKFRNGTAVSLGAGVRSGKRYLVSETARQVSITTPFSMGIFYDRNNSLLASVQVSDVSDYFIVANVYPGLIKIGSFSPGIWTVIDRKGHPNLGITSRYTLGTGLGYGFKKR